MNARDSIEREYPLHQPKISQSKTHLLCRLSEGQLKPIWDEVRHIKNNMSSAQNCNRGLAGNLKHQYSLTKCVESLSDIVLPLCTEYNLHTGYISKKEKILIDKKTSTVLNKAWVNFGRKTEFNPPHSHTGVMSFVIWLDIPYDINEEMELPHVVESFAPLAGHFMFQHVNTFGTISPEVLPVDKNMNDMIVVFPSGLIHQVFPFYTSDEYRISVSGNISIRSRV